MKCGQVAKKTLSTGPNGEPLPGRFAEKELLQVVENEPVFNYVDDPSRPDYPLFSKLRQALVDHSLKGADVGTFGRIKVFETELKEQLETHVGLARANFDKGSPNYMPNRVVECRSYPVYRFVREELSTELLSGTKHESPGEQIEAIHVAICEGKFVGPLMECLDGWNRRPGSGFGF